MKLSSSWWKETGHVLIKLASQIMILSQQTGASTRLNICGSPWISVLTHKSHLLYIYVSNCNNFPVKFPSYQQTLISLDEWYIQQVSKLISLFYGCTWFPNNSANISVVWWQRFGVSRSSHEVCITVFTESDNMLLAKCRFWYKTKRRRPYIHYSQRQINLF